MSVIQQLIDAGRAFNLQENYDGLAALFILPTEQPFTQVTQELQGISVSYSFSIIILYPHY